MADENERVQIDVTILGERLTLVLPSDGWTFEEAKLAKRVTADPDIDQPGMSLAQVEGGLLEGDPDAWLAVLRVSYMRARRDFPQGRIMAEQPLELMTELADATREAMRSRPPTSPKSNGPVEPPESSEPNATEPLSQE